MKLYKYIFLPLLIFSALFELFEYKMADSNLTMAIDYGKNIIIYDHNTLQSKIENSNDQQKFKISREAQSILISYVKHNRRKIEKPSIHPVIPIQHVSINPVKTIFSKFIPGNIDGLSSFLIRFMRC